jgi:hypothetical protein
MLWHPKKNLNRMEKLKVTALLVAFYLHLLGLLSLVSLGQIKNTFVDLLLGSLHHGFSLDVWWNSCAIPQFIHMEGNIAIVDYVGTKPSNFDPT